MGWKWDPTKPHNVQVTVAPAGVDESALGVIWGDNPNVTKIVKNTDAEKLLAQLLQDLQRLGYQV